MTNVFLAPDLDSDFNYYFDEESEGILIGDHNFDFEISKNRNIIPV